MKLTDLTSPVAYSTIGNILIRKEWTIHYLTSVGVIRS